MSSRETGNVFQSLKLNQTVFTSCGNFSNMFVAELVVLISVNLSYLTQLEGLLLHSYSQGVYTGVVSSVLMSVYAQKSTAHEWLAHVLDSLCPGCCCTLAH